MKTTRNIDEAVMDPLRRASARMGRSMSELVETALRQLLQRRSVIPELTLLPKFKSGGALLDVADRSVFDRAMDER
jgi:hypothetical protein